MDHAERPGRGYLRRGVARIRRIDHPGNGRSDYGIPIRPNQPPQQTAIREGGIPTAADVVDRTGSAYRPPTGDRRTNGAIPIPFHHHTCITGVPGSATEAFPTTGGIGRDLDTGDSHHRVIVQRDTEWDAGEDRPVIADTSGATPGMTRMLINRVRCAVRRGVCT